MARPKVYLPENLDQRFREAVFKRYGMKKGNLEKALCEAIELWLEKVK